MKRFQFPRLKYYWSQKWSRLSAIKFWLQDIKNAHERCAYCGWYLHPQLLFKGIERPSRLTYWHEENNLHICAKCHYLDKQLTSQLK